MSRRAINLSPYTSCTGEANKGVCVCVCRFVFVYIVMIFVCVYMVMVYVSIEQMYAIQCHSSSLTLVMGSFGL